LELFHLQDLNQLVAFQQEFSRRLAGTGQAQTIKILGVPNTIQTGKEIPTRSEEPKNC
jgi:hypothetical protein